MHALGPIHELRDVEIHGHTREHVGLFARQLLFAHQKIERLMHGDLGRFGEVRVEPHRDPMRWRLGARPLQMHVFMQDELEDTGERRFHGGDVHFAVAHAGVAVADFEERPARVHGNEQSGSGDEFLVIQIAGVNSRRSAMHFAGALAAAQRPCCRRTA